MAEPRLRLGREVTLSHSSTNTQKFDDRFGYTNPVYSEYTKARITAKMGKTHFIAFSIILVTMKAETTLRKNG